MYHVYYNMQQQIASNSEHLSDALVFATTFGGHLTLSILLSCVPALGFPGPPALSLLQPYYDHGCISTK